MIRNAGYQVTTYAGEPRQKLPFEIQAGITHKLAYAPFRFSLTYRHLEKYDITYQYKKQVLQEMIHHRSSGFADNLLRHVVLGTEFIPHKNFYLPEAIIFREEMNCRLRARFRQPVLPGGSGLTPPGWILNLEGQFIILQDLQRTSH